MITIYAKDRCQPCNATKRAFKKKGLIENEHYTVIQLEEQANPDALRAELIAKGHSQFPIVETPIGDWSGYRPDKIDELVAALASGLYAQAA